MQTGELLRKQQFPKQVKWSVPIDKAFYKFYQVRFLNPKTSGNFSGRNITFPDKL